jgi:hypothetical protein
MSRDASGGQLLSKQDLDFYFQVVSRLDDVFRQLSEL